MTQGLTRFILVPMTMAYLIVSFGACGLKNREFPEYENTPEDPCAQLGKLTIDAASPGTIHVGQDVSVTGSGFLSPQCGEQSISFHGTYTDDAGGTHPVDISRPAVYKSKTEISWRLWPDVTFHPQGDRIGSFDGEITITRRERETEAEQTGSVEVFMTVGPSVIVRKAEPLDQPADNPCEGSVVPSTKISTPFSFEVEAIGMQGPLTFDWNIPLSQWEVALNHSSGQVDMSPQAMLDQVSRSGTVLMQERTTGTTSSITEGTGRVTNDSFVVFQLLSDVIGRRDLDGGVLAALRTLSLPKETDSYVAQIQVDVTDGQGEHAGILLPMEVFRPATIDYDGNKILAQLYEPKLVTSECIPGGRLGRYVNYYEEESEGEFQEVGFNWSARATLMVTLGLPFEVSKWNSTLNVDGSFGSDGRAFISSNQSEAYSVSGEIFAGAYGAFYRQKSRWIRTGKIVGHDQCGRELPLGEVQVTDWGFSADLAIGNNCPPKTNLPAPAKHM